MRRSIGVTVIAIVSLLGSVFTLLTGGLMMAAPSFSPVPRTTNSPFSPQFFKTIMIGAAFFYILPAALGIATSIGLLRTKEWARISIIVFSVLLILMAAFGVLVFAVMPTPPSPHEDFPASVQEIMRILVPAFAGTLMCIGVWWLAFLVELPFCIVAAVVGGFTLGKITDWEADP